MPRGRALSLLALLLVHRGDVVHLDRVADELWEGEGPQNARNAVHVVASRLRAALGDERVRSEGGGYALRLPPGALDADRFEERLRPRRRAAGPRRPWEAEATLREALALWRGPALADVAEERFAQPEIARLEDLRLTCLSERIDAALACGRHAEVAAELEGLVREHPLRERLRGQLMLALYRAGRQADALAAYRDAHRALVDGLGIEPSPDLRALEAAILRQEVPEPAPPLQREPDARALGDLRGLAAGAVPRRPGSTPSRCAPWSSASTRPAARCSPATAAASWSCTATRSSPCWACRSRTTTTRSARCEPRRSCATSSRSACAPAPARARWSRPATRRSIGEALAVAERLARAAAGGEIRLAESTWQVVRHAARASPIAGGGFLLGGLDADAPAIAPPLRPAADRARAGARRPARHVRARRGEALARAADVLGEPGIGKSRLVAELAAIAGAAAACSPATAAPTARASRCGRCARRSRRPAATARRTSSRPSSASRRARSAASPPPSGCADGEPGEDTDWAFLQLVGALARRAPLALVVDDAHWAEPALLDLLVDLVARLRDAPLLVVWVARPELLERRPAGGATLTLRPLSAAASDSLLATLGGGRLPSAAQRQVAEAAGGNPLFLEQLVAYVDERRAADALPPALQALLAARLDRLDATERAALALGAVAGDTFTAASVHALATGITRVDAARACERLVERDLLVRGPRRGTLRFRHTLIRDVAYASLAKSARARLHERHADWLAELGDELAEADARIGFHLETAWRLAEEIGGDAPPELAARAGSRLAAAAAVAHGRGDLAGEIGFLDRAVALLGDDGRWARSCCPGSCPRCSSRGRPTARRRSRTTPWP